MTNDLKQHLQSNPQIKFVFVNDKGEWQFHQRPGFDKALTRDEVLDMEVASETPVEKDIARSTGTGVIPSVQDGSAGVDIEKLRADLRAELKLEFVQLLQEVKQTEVDDPKHSQVITGAGSTDEFTVVDIKGVGKGTDTKGTEAKGADTSKGSENKGTDTKGK